MPLRVVLGILAWLAVAAQPGVSSSCGGGPAILSAHLKRVSRNLAMRNHVIKSFTKRSAFACVATCIKVDQCVSVNYGGTEGLCELNGSSLDVHPEDSEFRDGWKYYGTVAAEITCPEITTTEPATTVPPTTLEPTTTALTTLEPTTTAPTTLEPTTTAPTTLEPTTTAPTTLEPTTTALTTLEPTTTAPTTLEPTTTAPTTLEPTTTAPTTLEPTTTVPSTTEKPPVDCWDIQSRSPSSVSGEYDVFPDLTVGSLRVYCDMETDGGGWTVFHRRIDNSQDFYLNWASYKAGFGSLSANFWLGNDALHELTGQQAYQIRIELESYTGVTTYARYGAFAVANEADKYRLTLGTFYGSYTAGDSFTLHNGQYFSTLDQDNDSDGVRHCAQNFLGAWWYNACFSSNLNGPFRNTDYVPATGQGIIWGMWLSVSKSLKFAEMKLRPASAQPVAKDCWDHYVKGETASGTYNIQVSGITDPVQVYCDMDDAGGGWTVIQRRTSGSVDFYLDWAAYKTGFGNLDGEFWLGNDNLHYLTNQGSYQLTVKLISWYPVTKYANFGTFAVADEADLYRLSIGQFFGSSSVGDSLANHNGKAWSTKDQDNDLDAGRHCAQNHQGAWWYNACEYSNLNGPFVPYPGTISSYNPGRGIVWGTWTHQLYSLKAAEMKVRPAHVGFTLP